jgi:LPS-assembly protein
MLMKNNFLTFTLTILMTIWLLNYSIAEEQFKFNVTEIEISNDGNLIIGSKGGKAETYDGHEITADKFVYNKSKNILNVYGNIKFLDENNNLIIFSDKATYFKNDEKIFTNGNSKAVSENSVITSKNFSLDIIKNVLIADSEVKFLDKNDGSTVLSDKATYQKKDDILFTVGNSKAVSENNTITAEDFKFDRKQNIIIADKNVKFLDGDDASTIFSDNATYFKDEDIFTTKGNSKAVSENNTITAEDFKFDRKQNIIIADKNVKFIDEDKNTIINTEKATYQKNNETILTEGKTLSVIENKYDFFSKNIKFNRISQELSSKEKSKIIDDNENEYFASSFLYQIENTLLKAKEVKVLSKVDKNKTDTYFFSEGFFDFAKKSFVSKDTKIKVHKDIFGNEDQDPRLFGSSSYGDKNLTILNKGIFTSCKINDNCPPWSIRSEKITHDKINRDLIYKNAVLKIYDIPVLYFPKFFHPDPTVERRTGFLQPQFNGSKTLGSSIYLPYFKTLGIDKDYTFKPTVFEDKFIFQNEFRKKTYNSFLISDFSLTNGYKSSADNKKKNINHLFVNYQKDLNFSNFVDSKLDLKIERVNNDTYLKVFQNNLSSSIMPEDNNLMVNKLDYILDHNDYNFSAGFQIYEKLGTTHSDKYQYILPKYDFSRNLNFDTLPGSINFYSSGSNNLKNTNNLRSSITNDIHYNSKSYFTNSGFNNKFNLYFKNLNSVGKNDPTYKSSPRVEGMSIFEISSSLPLVKQNNFNKEILIPKISLRANPGNNMKNYSSKNQIVTANNIFEINRLSIDDSFESGKSLTIGFDYKLDFENKKNSKDKYLEFKLASVFRDKVENEIPVTSTINNKNSNLLGSINNKLFENLSLGYDFSINNNYNTFDSHAINTEISVNNFITEFNYIEERNNIGSSHLISNKTTYEIDNNNSLMFSTRRNKEISLTEYYDFSYQYKNDCLTAGIKFNKTFYKDKDLEPTENLFFTISLIPLTTYERKIYDR